MKKRPYKEGAWFAIPLEGGGFATGLVARCTPKGGLCLAYLFGPVRERIPTLDDVKSLRRQDAAKVWHVGDSHLMKGKWPLVGHLDSWERDEWPSPQFVRIDPLGQSKWRVTYSDVDTNEVVGEERIPFAESGYETSRVCGSLYVEKVLRRFLA